MDLSMYDACNKVDKLEGVIEGSTYSVQVFEDTLVQANCPLELPYGFSGSVNIYSDNKSKRIKLVLMCTEDMQPCIGPATNTGQSYGRFSESHSEVTGIMISNVDVICIPHESNPYFTIGTYGMSYVPLCTLYNGSLSCPELNTNGTRLMVNDIVCYSGSTKRTGRVRYFIQEPGVDPNTYFTDEQREWCDKLISIRGDIEPYLKPTVPAFVMKRLAEILPYAPVVECLDYFLERPNSPTYYMTLRSCVLLGMDTSKANDSEFMFECDKLEFQLDKHFTIDVKECHETKFNGTRACAIAMLAHLCRFCTGELDERAWEVAYEMIPAYAHDFLHGVPHKENVIKFITDNVGTMYENGYEEQFLRQPDDLSRLNRLLDIQKSNNVTWAQLLIS